MANYNTLKAAIAAVIKENGNNEITGPILQQTLLAMVNSLGANYQFAGIATPSTNPGTPDQNVFYLASTAGTYANFGGLVLADGEIAILKYNGAWSKDSTGAATQESVNQLGQEVNESLGYDVQFTQGGLNYLNGQETEDSKSIRTTFIECSADKTLRFQFGRIVTNIYIVKYLGTTYVGYISASITSDIAKLNVEADNTFDCIRVRVSSSTDWDDTDINASSINVVNTSEVGDITKTNAADISRFITPQDVLVTPNVNFYTQKINSCIKGLYLPSLPGGYKITTLRRNNGGQWNIRVYTSDLSNLFNFTWSSSPEGNTGITYASVVDANHSIGKAYIIVDWNKIPVGTFYTSLTDDSYLVSSVCYEKNTYADIGVMMNTDDNSKNESSINDYRNEIGRYIFFEKGAINYIDGTESASDNDVRSDYIPINTSAKLSFASDKWFQSVRIIKYKGISSVPVSSEVISMAQGRVVVLVKDDTFDNVRIRIQTASVWSDEQVRSTNCCIYVSPSINEVEEDTQNTNLYSDPHFKFPKYNGMNGIWVDYYNPTLTEFADGCVLARSSSQQAKGMYIEMRMTPQWLLEHGLTDGQTITIGCDVRAEVSSVANITNYKFFQRTESSQIEKSLPLSFEERFIPSIGEVGDWQRILTKVIIKAIATNYNYYYITLGYIQLTDTGADDNNPDILYVKNPFITIGDSTFNFSESAECLNMEKINTREINTLNVNLVSPQTELKDVFILGAEKTSGRWLELKENFAFPSNGVFIGRIGDDVFVCVNGKLTKINN